MRFVVEPLSMLPIEVREISNVFPAESEDRITILKLKKSRTFINRNWVTNQACSLPQNNRVVRHLFVASDNMF